MQGPIQDLQRAGGGPWGAMGFMGKALGGVRGP